VSPNTASLGAAAPRPLGIPGNWGSLNSRSGIPGNFKSFWFVQKFVQNFDKLQHNLPHYRQACASSLSHASIVFTQWSKNGFFAPQGRHVAPLNVNFGMVPPCQISRLSGAKMWKYIPKTVKISNFRQKFVPQGRLMCNLFTKFSAFVRGYSSF